MKVAHIFSEEKFVDNHIAKYEQSSFDNLYFYLKKINNYSGKSTSKVKYILPKSEGYWELVESVDNFDLIFLHFLDYLKLEFLFDIKSTEVPILWSFYGAEIYSLPIVKAKMFSPETEAALGKNIGMEVLRTIQYLLSDFLFFIKTGMSKRQFHSIAYGRIHSFLWSNRFEYEMLEQISGYSLPPFLHSNLSNKIQNLFSDSDKENKILLGNSRSPFNNHLEVIGILNDANYSGEITIPFNYSPVTTYSSNVQKKASKSNLNIKFIKTFIPLEEYMYKINSHSAAIYNSYRQMGLGNIFIAINCGLKIYMSERNPSYRWLKEEGFFVFSVENHLVEDLQKGLIRLDPEQIETNYARYSKLVDSNNLQDFFTSLTELVEKAKIEKS